MTDWPLVIAMLVTYQRTELAVRTVRGVQRNLVYPGPLGWHVADDGSPPGHVADIAEAINAGPRGADTSFSDAQRKGAGHSMNFGMEAIRARNCEFILWLEDDWELVQPFDLAPAVKLLQEHEDIGMVRLGYMSAGITGSVMSGAGQLWWRLAKGPTYTFTGHASLRHRRFADAYGPYQEGITAGQNELYMCGTFNNRPGPDVVIPTWTGPWGPFGHIGGVSLNDVAPET